MILVVIAAMTGCGDQASAAPDQTTRVSSAPAVVEWGPLAVWNDPGTGDGDLPLLSGTVSIDDHCVTVEGHVLVWPATFTRWVLDDRTIEFLDPLARVVVSIRDGDRVELGGGEIIPGLPWIARPDATCPANLFGVGSIGSVNGLAP